MRPFRLIVYAIIILAGGLCNGVAAEVYNLEQCLEMALKNHPDIIRAEGSARVAGAGLWSAAGQFLPSLSVGGRVSQDNALTDQMRITRIDDLTYDTSYYRISKSYGLSLNAGLTVFDGGQDIFNYLGARADKAYYNYLKEQSRQNLALTVKTYYFAYLAALKINEIQDEAVKRGEEQLKLAESKFEVGSASKSDVLKARVQYGNDRLSLIEAENGVKKALADLAYIIGVDVNSDIQFSTDYKGRDYSGTEDEALKFGMSHHPGFLAAEKSMTAAKYGRWSAYGDYLPRVDVSFSKGYGNEFWHEVKSLNKEDGSWSISTSVSWTIFDHFVRERTLSSAKVGLNNARAEYYYQKNAVALDIKKNYLDMKKAAEQLNVALENEGAAREDMTLVQEKYNLGAATILELLDAQVSLITAQNNKIQSEFDFNLAVAALENAMGVR